MYRPIVYPGSIPQDTDLLKTNQAAMIALGFLAQATLGTSTLADGLACTPTTPAGLSVLVGPGSICGVQSLEATSYGSLAADTTDQIVKQGIVLGNTTFTLTPPATSGQSQVYLVQAEYQEIDGGSTVLPYYNAANPSVPYSGPANSGTAQNTIRQGKCILALKAGTAATTGTQATPTPDAGYVGLWAITVANGATTITSGNIAQYPGAPFIGTKLPSRISGLATQSFNTPGSYTYTPTAGMAYALAFVTGGGGGGGGGNSSTYSGGAGGAAGGTGINLFAASTIGGSQAVTVAAGGTGGSAGNPGNTGLSGGTSSLGTLLSATGGDGGGYGLTGAPTPYIGGGSTGGLLNLNGSGGNPGLGTSGASVYAFGGAGGDSFWGGAGYGGTSVVTPYIGYYGSGGGGGTGGNAGGIGGSGVVFILEFLTK